MKSKKKIFIIILAILMSSIISTAFLNTQDQSDINKNKDIQKNADSAPQESFPFIPDPPTHSGNYWDFQNDTIVGWHMESSYGSKDYVYNISSMRWFYDYENATGSPTPWEAYGVELESVYYDASINDFSVSPNTPVMNVSLINYTNPIPSEKMIPFKAENSDDIGPILNLFVPKNSSDKLDILWCADALRWMYSFYLTGTPPGIYAYMTITSTSIHYNYVPLGTYCDLYYSDEGILETGEMRAFMGGGYFTVNFTRISDLNPLDDTEWDVDVGDVLYMGVSYHEFKFNISKIENISVSFGPGGMISLQIVWANMSAWNISTEAWDYVDMAGGVNWIIIGSANDEYPFVYPGDGNPFIPLLMPVGFTIPDLADVMEMRGEDDDPTFLTTYGDDWVQLSNSSGYVKYIYNASGFVELIDQNGYEDLFGYDEVVAYRKNSTFIDASKIWELEIIPIDIDSSEFNISLDIKVTGKTHLLTSAMNVNPLVNHSLGSGTLFFDIWVNNTNKLDLTHNAPINITIDYDKSKYKNMKLYWFNTSTWNPDEIWQPIDFTDYGNGTIVFTVNHTSIFAFTNVISQLGLIPGAADDDDDDDDAPAIPIGNYYLIFIAIAVIGLVILKKRELFKK